MKAAWVLLTTGGRPAELQAAVASIADQTPKRESPEILVVGNGAVVDPPPPATVLTLPENVGVAAGRNAGVSATSGDVVFFLDDDAACASTTLTAATLRAFADDDRLGIVSFRVSDPSGDTQRRHVPRLRVGDPATSSQVTTFLGGACAIRRALLREVGGYPDAFFYAMEETDLAWRALDAGWRIEYRGDLLVHHPATTPTRHGGALRHTARNRAWLARRRLPLPLVPVYLGVWCALTLARARSVSAARETLSGFLSGLREPAGERRPIRWRTVWLMTRLGRPPIV